MLNVVKAKAFLYSLMLLSCFCDAVYKRWVPNTNFDNPDNWNEGSRLPCPNELVEFPATCPVVLIKQGFTLKELRLPSNGMILLEPDITLVFNDHPSTDGTSCNKTRGITFINDRPAYWTDPNNWCIPKFDLGPECMDNALFLDTERVPCALDDVVFPGDSSFFVKIDFPEDISMRSFRLGNMYFQSDGLESYFKTIVGLSQFRRAQPPNPQHRLLVTQNTCYNDTGCMCGNDNGWRKQQICNLMTSHQDCYSGQCTGSFIPVGHCCHVCGSMLVLEYLSNFHLIHFKQFVQQTFIDGKDSAYQGVKVIVSKRYDDKIQLVLTDDTHGTKAARLGPLVAEKINEALEMRGVSRIVSVTKSFVPTTITSPPVSPATSPNVPPTGIPSGSPSPATGSTPDGSSTIGTVKPAEALSLEAVAGISAAGVAVLLLLILALACIVCRNWRRTSLLPFKKFRPDVTYPSVSADFSDPGNPSVRGFDNPMYGESASNGTQLQEMHSRRLSADPTAGFDNPLYDSPLEGNFYSDPSRVDSSVKVNPVYSTMGIEEETNA